ncbi:MAG: tetratricopeptide repeat protein, partial [Chlorobi bacterium]|nr:tetratricopeptide repeat protein [Chlorobiota bacterium]
MKLAIKILLLALVACISVSAQGIEEGFKRQALNQMQSGRFGEAIDLLNKYIAQNAQKADGYNLRGLCYEKRTQYAKAVLDFRRAHKIEPDNIEIKKNLDRTLTVWHALLRKRIEGFKREIAIDPSNPFNYLEIGKSYRWLEEWSLAEQWYDEYLKRDDNASPDEIIRYTIILVKTGHIKKGEKILKKYVERYPGDWRLWSRYGYFTLWLGKNNIAKDAFTKSLGFKPFFKEAQDGLDLATKKGYITLYQPEDYEKAERERKLRQVPQEYPIDKYFRIVNKNPDDVDTRFALIDELIVADRWEEAYQQIQLIPPEYEDKDRYQLLWDKISKYRENQYMSKIEELHYNLKKNPDNPETVKELAITYSSKEDYEDAEEILTDFLQVHPDNDSLGFLYAKILSYDRRYDEAYEQAIKVVDENPDKPKYRLLAGQLGTWLNRDTDRALEDLEAYKEAYPDDIYGLIALGTLSFARQEYDAAEEFEKSAEAIDPDNSDLLQLKSMIELKKLRDEEDKKIEQLNYGRELAYNKEYEEAIPYYEEYLQETGGNREIEAELADVYMGAERYDDALNVYDNLLDDEYDLDIAKRRVTALLDVSDSLKA